MNSIDIKGSIFEQYISPEQIKECVKNIAARINTDYQGKTVLFIGVLNGAAPFLTDLVREITLDTEVDFMRVSSYNGLESSGDVKISLNMKGSIKGRHVIVVEDILETGLTMMQLEKVLRNEQPASLELCVFCRKPALLKHEIHPKYFGMDLDPDFLVGYGLDYDEKGRHLPGIYKRVKALEH